MTTSKQPQPTLRQEDDVAELFRKAAEGNASGIAEMLRFRPELARCRNAMGLSILQFARYMRQDAVLTALIQAGPPLTVFEASEVDDVTSLASALERNPQLVYAYGPNHETPLHVAAAAGSAQCISKMVEAGARLETPTRNDLRQTALHAAIEHRQLESVQALLRHGADPNARRRGGETAMMMAAAANSREIVEMLVTRNANVDVRDEQGRTSSDIAAARGYLALAERLQLGERIIDRSKA